MIAEVSSSQTRARMRGAISITVILSAELGGRGGDLEPDHAAADQDQRFARVQVRLQRQRLGFRAQIVDAGPVGAETSAACG